MLFLLGSTLFILLAAVLLPGAALEPGLFSGGEGPSLAIIASVFVEEWVQDIREKLRDANPHLRRAVDHSRFITSDGKTVHVPYENQDPGIEVNRSVFPAQIEELSDADLDYTMDWISTNPSYIKNKYLDEISYDYRRSILRRHEEKIAQEVGARSIHSWAPSGQDNRIVRTTGANTNTKPDGAAGGDRKALTIQDIRRLRKLFRKMNITGMRLVIQFEPELHAQLEDLKEVQDVDLGGTTSVNREGVVGTVAGFEVLEPMNKVPIYDNSNPPVKKARGAAVGADDNLAAIAWAESEVSQAEGDIMVNINENRADFYGTIVSAEAWHGAHFLRPDQIGRAAIVQAHA